MARYTRPVWHWSLTICMLAAVALAAAGSGAGLLPGGVAAIAIGWLILKAWEKKR